MERANFSRSNGPVIAKHISMRSAKRSSFAGLVAYITNAQDRTERIGAIRLTNVAHLDVAGAILEVEATQGRNVRALGDKTYHLVISFRPAETPSDEALQAAEDALCAGLGFAGHQRVSAVHYDTDNTHIHIAINKIHPTRHILVEPYLAYRRIGEICAQVERDFGLAVDNHEARKSRGDWIRRNCLEDLRAANSWADVISIASNNGLQIRERGAGFVFLTKDGVVIKASTVARDLSRAAWERRLGEFSVPAQASGRPGTRRYEHRPPETCVETTALFARYQSENGAARTVREDALREARARRNVEIEAAKRAGRLIRAALKLSKGGSQSKKLSYVLNSRKVRLAIETARDQFERECGAINNAARPLVWADWLQDNARRGNVEALAALRARRRKPPVPGEAINLAGVPTVAAGPIGGASVDNVTKTGTIIFTSRAGAVRDDGVRLSLSRGADLAAIGQALRIAQARYGNNLQIEGSAAFQARVAALAAVTLPTVRFGDAQLERQRIAYVQQWQEKQGERQFAARRVGGLAGDSGGVSGSLGGSTETRQWGRGADRPGVRGIGLAPPEAADQLRARGVIGGPPPGFTNRLRTLSELDVVCFAGRSEVLLPRDAQHQLEHERAERADDMRRSVFRVATAIEAAEAYINERNAKRSTMADVREHVHYTGVTESIIFAGARTIQGHRLALFERGDVIVVKSIDDDEAAALPKHRGKVVQIVDGRIVRSRGRRTVR
jgi:hypothetical protein